MKINISELNRTTGISRPTLIKWKKAGLLESELAKKGFGFEPGAVPDPVTGEVPGDGIALGRQTASLMQSDFKLDPELAALAKHMNDKFGPGSVMYGGIGLPKTEFVSTGVPEIDKILGGGVALGRLLEIYGRESSGKTTLALHIAAQFVRKGMKAVYLDTEHAIDRDYAAHLGYDTGANIFVQPTGMEECGEFLREYCRKLKRAVIIVDSIAAMHPTAEYENSIGAANMGLKARILGQIIRIIAPDAADNLVSVIFINQLRTNLQQWGSPEYTPGGHSLKFAASQRLEMKPKMNKDDEKERLIKIKCVKNKVAMPLEECEISVYFGEGFIKKRDEKSGS